MLSDEDILLQASENIRVAQEFLKSAWRPSMDEAYAVREGYQWVKDEWDRVTGEGLTPYTLNLTDPICNAIIGFQVQNRSEVSYVPRLLGENKQKAASYADMVDNGVNYIEDCSQAEYHDSHAFSDMVTCGVGACDNIIDYAINEFGHPQKERIFPGFALWDTAARGKNFLDANWCARGKVVLASTLEDEADDEEEGDFSSLAGTFDDSYFTQYFDRQLVQQELAVVYDYQWRQKEPVSLIKNPFSPESPYLSDPLVMNWLPGAAERLGFDYMGGVISIRKEHWKGWKEETAALGITYDRPVKQRVWRYYRATIWGGRVRSKSLNFCQKGFSIKFMTGKFSERDQVPYGVVHDLTDPQRLLNQAVTDLQGWARSNPMGGVIIEDDAVADIKAFVKTFRKGRDVTVVKSGSIAAGKIQVKEATQFPVGVQQMAQFYADMMLRVAGVTPEFMGQMDTKDMTGVLHAQIVRQGLTVLAPYFDAMRFYVEETGRLYIDMLRVLAENHPMRPIRNITGQTKDQEYLPLLEDYIAPEYDIEIVATPLTPTQKQETFETLMKTGFEFAQVQPALSSAMVAKALDYSPLRPEDVEEVKQAAAPKPPQPDPLNASLIMAETKAKIAEAGQKEADAVLKRAQAVKALTEAGQPAEAAAAGVPVDPIASRELDHKAKIEGEKLKADRDAKAYEAIRAASEDEAKRDIEERKLKLEERKLEIEAEKLKQAAKDKDAEREEKQKDRDHGAKMERDKLRMANPKAAEALDMLDKKRESVDKESEARISALIKSSEQQTRLVADAMREIVKSQGQQAKDVSKAISGMGKGMEKLAAGQAVLLQSSRKAEEGIAQMADSIEALSRPRKKTFDFARNEAGLIESAEVTETVQ